MADEEARGNEFEKKAEKKLSGRGIFGSKYQDAANLYYEAASCYRLAKKWEKAAATFTKLAEIRIKLEKKFEAATAYHSASDCYQNFSMREAARALNESVKIFLEIDELHMASRYSKDLGELFVASHDLQKAMDSFERAADLFQKEEEWSYLNFCKQRVAQVAAQLEQYPKAVKIYEEMARQPMSNSLLKCSVEAILLNAGICQLCTNDPVAMTNSLQQYQEIDPNFSGTHEYKLLTDLATLMEEEDVEKFTAAIKDKMTHLDDWKMILLSRVTNKLKVKKENEGNVKEEVKNESDATSKDGEGKKGTESQAKEEVPERGTESQANEEVPESKDTKSQANEEVPESKVGEGNIGTKSQANEEVPESKDTKGQANVKAKKSMLKALGTKTAKALKMK